MKRLLCGFLSIELVGPLVDDRFLVEIVDVSHDAVLELLLGGDADVAQHGACHLREEAFDKVQPGAVFGSEDELEAALGLQGEPSIGLLGDVGGMIVEDQLDRRVAGVGGIDLLEEFDERAAAMALFELGMESLPLTRSMPAKRLSVPWRTYS